MNLKMRLKDEWKLGLSEGLDQGRAEGKAEGLSQGRAEGKAEGSDEMAFGLIHALQAQGMPPKQIVEAQHYYEQMARAANGGEH